MQPPSSFLYSCQSLRGYFEMNRLIAIVLIASSLPLIAQQGRGSIVGTIRDASGAGVPDAQVRIVNTGTNAAFSTTTNESGYFTAPSLQVGSYAVTAEKPGFKKFDRTGITLQVDQCLSLDLQLEVGAATESIQV